MTGDDNLLLRLNEFESNVKLFWKELQIENDFFDVILASEDKQINAHKIVISSCSPVFRNILKLNQNPQPLIYLRKVKHKDLLNLVTFMYQGEVNVVEEDLGSFLEAAEDLQIRGLTETNLEDFNSNQDSDEYSQYLPQQMASSPKRKRRENESKSQVESSSIRSDKKYDSDNNSQSLIKCQNQSGRVMKRAENNRSLVLASESDQFICQKCNKMFNSKAGIYYHNKSIHEGVLYSCDQCDYKATTKHTLKQHIDSVHQKLSVTCDKCDKQFSKLSNLRKHNSSIHEDVHYPCEYCDYKATQRIHLHRHRSSKHQNELSE